jgi:hypothetical protein
MGRRARECRSLPAPPLGQLRCGSHAAIVAPVGPDHDVRYDNVAITPMWRRTARCDPASATALTAPKPQFANSRRSAGRAGSLGAHCFPRHRLRLDVVFGGTARSETRWECSPKRKARQARKPSRTCSSNGRRGSGRYTTPQRRFIDSPSARQTMVWPTPRALASLADRRTGQAGAYLRAESPWRWRKRGLGSLGVPSTRQCQLARAREHRGFDHERPTSER